MRPHYTHLKMSIQTYAILLCTFMFNPFVNAAHDWSYEDQEIWSHQYPECSGNAQSPVNFDKRTVSMNVSMNLDFYGYQNLIFGFNVVNNGHSVQFNYIGDERSAPILTGSALNHENYSLAQFHFHWAQDRGYGSEHTVNDKSYSMEMHLVHFNRYRYSTLKDALDSGKGVVVLGVFFQIERKNNDLLNEVTRMVHVVQDRHSNFTANPEQPLVVDHLLPNAFNRKKFYRYSGSLTTPPCTEGVTWIVMAHPNNIGYEQIEQFRKVRNYHKKELIGSNYRNTQSVRDRLVEASFNAQRDSTASTKLSGMLVTLSLVSLLFANRNH